MRALVCAFTLATLAACPTQAMDRSLVRQFEKLDPQTRLEQRCDTEAMERIGADKNRFKPDKVIAYTFADPVMKGDKMKATGAVFRSNGDWYKLAFRCKTDSEHLEVLSFEYKIGERVPRENWDQLYLYP
ncbi:DUF930 domain-containing protein [Sinorhizobium meliloti]|uniref:DUF930 domain-containing protein n=1 Tax=Rhizobium meliloti TaxID=382 RepID=UPI00299DEB03|nr:DUF930 domain-containing protein [Sinorhizobium meliloti]MDW9870049.1 DUF930 domain-containing protein [Sinorhizobium meliloti]MDW9882280.1 DUF930 domain-containing protein [Sinorhizobium meliloti]MDX0204127.1 DUF930 domain-containing protein [Sinorhizobium meliloti]